MSILSLKDKIKLNISKLPDDKLKKIDILINTFIQDETPKIVKLQGIWKNIGFEEIDDLDSEIKIIRKESEKLIEKRIKNWNI